ncbi:MAG: phosphoenolpyruvate-utilizing N-terminal domain-containing protein [Candidatus Ornithomonoglobus sp.]
MENNFNNECPVRRYHIDDSNEEIRRFEKARAVAKEKLQSQFVCAAEEEDEDRAAALSAQIEALDDDTVIETVYDVIADEMINAEVALAQTCDKLIQGYAENEGSEQRACAIHAASELIIRILLGIEI